MAVKYTITKSVTENLGDLLVSAGYPRADLDKVTFGAVTAIDEDIDGNHVNTSIKVTVKKALADKIELAGLTVEESGEDKIITHKFNRLDFLKEIGVTESTPAIRNEVYGEVLKTDEVLDSYLHGEHLEKDNFNVEIKEAAIDYADKLVAVLTPKDEFAKVALPSKLYMARKLIFTHPDHKVVHKVKFLTDVLGSLTNTVETTFEGVDGDYNLAGINPTELSNIPTLLRGFFTYMFTADHFDLRKDYLLTLYPDEISGQVNPKLVKDKAVTKEQGYPKVVGATLFPKETDEIVVYTNDVTKQVKPSKSIVGKAYKMVLKADLADYPSEVVDGFGAGKKLDFTTDGFTAELVTLGSGENAVKAVKVSGTSITNRATAEAALTKVVDKLKELTHFDTYAEENNNASNPIFDSSSITKIYSVKAEFGDWAKGRFGIVVDYPSDKVETTERLNGFSGIEGI